MSPIEAPPIQEVLEFFSQFGHGAAVAVALRRWDRAGIPREIQMSRLEAWRDTLFHAQSLASRDESAPLPAENGATRYIDPQLAFWYFQGVTGDPSLPPAAVRAGFRLALRFPYVAVVKAIHQALGEYTSRDTLAKRLREIAAPFRKDRAARTRASVGLGSVRMDLEIALTYLLPRHRFVVLQASKGLNGRVPSAATDGSSIQMPTRCAVSTDPATNQLILLYLLAHEAAHLETGSFAPNLRSAEGQILRMHLVRRRSVRVERAPHYRTSRQQAIADQLKKEGVGSGVPRKGIPAITWVYLHFHPPQADVLHMLHNLVDDARVDRWLCTNYPGLRLVHAAYERSTRAFEPDATLRSLEPNFLRALADRAYRRPIGAILGGRYRRIWPRVLEILAAREAQSDASPEGALLTALHLYEALETEDSSEWLEIGRVAPRALEKQEVIAERLRYRSGDWRDPRAAWDSGLPLAELREREPNPNAGSWYSTDEYDAIRGRLEPRVARIRERVWRPFGKNEEHAQLALSPAPARLELAAIKATGTREDEYHDSGSTLDLDLAHDWLAAAAAKVPLDNRLFVDPKLGIRPWLASFVIDLSVSMKQPRVVGREAPILRALSLVLRYEPALTASGCRMGVFGVHDSGRRSVTLQIVSDWREPFAASRVAAVRRIAGRVPVEFRGYPHVIVLLADDGSKYITAGIDFAIRRVVRVEKCYACDGIRCPWDSTEPMPCFPKSADPKYAYFYPPGYEYADIGAALRANPRLSPMMVMLDDYMQLDQVRRHIPGQAVVRYRTDDDLPLVDRALERMIRAAARKAVGPRTGGLGALDGWKVDRRV